MLKEGPLSIYVDIGVDVIQIPLDQIESRTADSESARDETPQAERTGIYSTALLPVRNVNILARQYGPGVVLIQTPSGSGSGFLINDRGHCVTNYHVIEQETRIAVTIFHRNSNGEFLRKRIDDIQIVALNPFFDLALLQIPPQKEFKFRPVFLNADDKQREGDLVFGIGNPLGLERSVSQGIISTKNRSIDGLVYIQTTAQINPGNSGGPCSILAAKSSV